MKSNDNQIITRPDMTVSTDVSHTTARPGRRSVNSFWLWLIIILAVLYVISPIDFLPDFIPIVGWIDDVVVALTAISIALPKILKRNPQS